MNQIDLKGRVAYVTGGAQGIGYAVAKRMLESGARVTLFDRDAAVLKEAAATLGDGASTAVVDVTDPEGIAAAMQAVRARDGSVDIGVNNAGIAGAAKPELICPALSADMKPKVMLNGARRRTVGSSRERVTVARSFARSPRQTWKQVDPPPPTPSSAL